MHRLDAGSLQDDEGRRRRAPWIGELGRTFQVVSTAQRLSQKVAPWVQRQRHDRHPGSGRPIGGGFRVSDLVSELLEKPPHLLLPVGAFKQDDRHVGLERAPDHP